MDSPTHKSAVPAVESEANGLSREQRAKIVSLLEELGRGRLEAKLDVIEYELIVEALKRHGGNTTEAARELGLTRRILGLRMKKHNIHYKNYRFIGSLG